VKRIETKSLQALEAFKEWQGTFCIMGQLVFYEASLIYKIWKHREIECMKKLTVIQSFIKKPETEWSNHEQAET